MYTNFGDRFRAIWAYDLASDMHLTLQTIKELRRNLNYKKTIS